jgi:hypothetical protein
MSTSEAATMVGQVALVVIIMLLVAKIGEWLNDHYDE